MASPFPGMDPYLEGDLWPEFHETLASAIRAQLVAQLPPTYAALLAKRYVVERPALGVFEAAGSRVFYPDAHVVQARNIAEQAENYPQATLTPPTIEIASPTFVPQLSVEIRDVAERRLVTLVEILSPSNKIGEGVSEYHGRRLDLFQTNVHIIELDLLRGGERITLDTAPPQAAYYAYLSRSERRPFTLVWAIQLAERLPVLPVPLRAPDADLRLDLQAAVDACFALVGYERLIDYQAIPPTPELDATTATWVHEIVQRLTI